MTPATPEPSQAIPDQSPLLSQPSSEPTTFEIIQIAALLATSEDNRNKSPVALVEQAMVYWDAVREVRQNNNERRILLATVAKMRDGEQLFGTAADTNENRKTLSPITDQMWLSRFCEYPGDKFDLFWDLLRTDVSAKDFKKELFPSPEKPVTELMDDLVKYGGNNWETRAFDLAFLCLRDQPENERDSLLSAITTGDLTKAHTWLDAHDRDGFCHFSLSLLLHAIRVLNQGSFPRNLRFPAILCREFIRLREQQISGVRANAARQSVKQRLRRKRRKIEGK